jgi:hypothetical protein
LNSSLRFPPTNSERGVKALMIKGIYLHSLNKPGEREVFHRGGKHLSFLQFDFVDAHVAAGGREFDLVGGR